VALSGLLVVGLVAGTAGAAPAHKRFTASITPETSTAGTEVDFELTVTNTSPNTELGAVRVTVPDGFTSVGNVEVDRPGWSVSGAIVAVADSSQTRLEPGESLVISFTATTPLQDGDTDYIFDLDARQANNFIGPPGNGLNLVGGAPVVTVTGTAVACNPDCQTNFAEAGTTVQVNSGCEPGDGPCGILVTDLDEVCPTEVEPPCVGQSVFWKPPNGATEFVSLRLEVPVEGEDFPRFWVQFEGEDPFECSLDEGGVTILALDDHYYGSSGYYEEEPPVPADCTYTIEQEGGVYVIEAEVAPVDPRGFAS
jgi:hypothetical protein